MKALKEKKKAEKEKKRKEREERKAKRKNKKKRVGFAAAPGGDDEEVVSRKKKKGKTDKMLDEMGDAKKYLSKLRNKRKQQKSKANLLGSGSRKKSMFFKDRKAMMLDPAEISKLQSEANDDY